MKRLFELGNRYAGQSTWKDFALVKFCLCAIGVMIGINIPKKHRRAAACAAAGVFAVTYVPLMQKVLMIAAEMIRDDKEKAE